MTSKKPIARFILFGSIAAAAIGGCSDRHDNFGQFTTLPDKGWTYNDTVAIIAAGLDSTDTPRRFKIGVRHDNDYDYRNLILEVTYRDGRKLWRDTIDMELSDIYGAWLGSGIGPTYQAETTVSPSAHISDSATITIRHVMRLDTLRGIRQIGVIIDKP